MFSALKDKQFLKRLLVIGMPIAIQNLITYSVGLMDTLMLGMVGEVQLSAAAMAGQLFFILMILLFGTAGGANILLAQYWGKGDKESMKSILAITYRAGIAVSLVFTLMAILMPRQIMSIFTPDVQVISEGVKYLKIVGWSYLFYGISNIVMMTLRSVGSVNISIVVYLASLVVNTFFNWVFIFGKLGAPAMGISGAALATFLARIVEFIITVIYVAFFEKRIGMKLRDYIHYDKTMVKDFISNASPVMLNELLWSTGASAISVIIGRMGTSFMAANSITTSVNQIAMVLNYGVSNAAGVIIGNTIGEGEREKAKKRANAAILISILVGLCTSFIMFNSRSFILSFYNLTEATKLLAMDVMTVSSVVVIFQSLAVITLVGVLRSGGDSKFVLWCDIALLWCFAVPVGAITGLWLGWAPPVVFAILRSDEIIKSIAALLRITKGNWIRDVTR